MTNTHHAKKMLPCLSSSQAKASKRLRLNSEIYTRRLIATVAPAAARSCFPLALRPAARGRLLVPIGILPGPPLPPLVRLFTLDVVAAVAPDALLVAPENGLCGLGPVLAEGPTLVLVAGGSGSGRGPETVLVRLTGDGSRTGILASGAMVL